MSGEPLSKQEIRVLNQSVETWRERLTSVSWLMKIVNHAVAVMANEEDECKGHFWEGRFKSQALLDESALLACMAYVDLNPIRAEMAETPEASEFTSIKKRIESVTSDTAPAECLDEFVAYSPDKNGIPFNLADYIDLLEWSGQVILPDKPGFISHDTPEFLSRMKLSQAAWRSLITQFERHFNHWVGSERKVRRVYQKHHYQRMPSTCLHRQLFG